MSRDKNNGLIYPQIIGVRLVERAGDIFTREMYHLTLVQRESSTFAYKSVFLKTPISYSIMNFLRQTWYAIFVQLTNNVLDMYAFASISIVSSRKNTMMHFLPNFQSFFV